MKAEKTRHCLNQTEGLICGFKTEMNNRIVGLAHIKSAQKELAELEAKAAKWDIICFAIDNKISFVKHWVDGELDYTSIDDSDLEECEKLVELFKKQFIKERE